MVRLASGLPRCTKLELDLDTEFAELFGCFFFLKKRKFTESALTDWL